MKKIINLFFVFLLLFSLVNAITEDEKEQVLEDLNLVRGSEQAFRGLLEDLNNKNTDLSKEKEIKLVIKEKADYFDINLKEEYPNIKLYSNLFIYILIIVILIGLVIIFILTRRKKNEI